MKVRPGSIEAIPDKFNPIVGANIRTLRQRRGWSQAQLGVLMGWPTNATVCAAEGRRGGRQRRFSAGELCRLAAIFGVAPWQLTTNCANCGGNPPTGFACLTCGAREVLTKSGHARHVESKPHQVIWPARSA